MIQARASKPVVGKIMTKDERTNAIQQLVLTIPIEKDALFAWEIQWKFCDKVRVLLTGRL